MFDFHIKIKIALHIQIHVKTLFKWQKTDCIDKFLEPGTQYG